MEQEWPTVHGDTAGNSDTDSCQFLPRRLPHGECLSQRFQKDEARTTIRTVGAMGSLRSHNPAQSAPSADRPASE